jgi:ribosomal protein S18 acetylase RimI-like enzyme
MPTEVSIRSATMDDYSSICRLLRELDDHHVSIRPDVFQPFNDPRQQRERVTGFVNSDDAELFVAEINFDIVGLATVRVSDNPDAPMFLPGRRACMDDLVVNREFRGVGIAKKLLESVTEWAQSRKLPCLVINVWNNNQAGVSFFTKRGFALRCQQMELQIEKTT